LVKDPVAHGQRADDAEPNLARLLRQRDQGLPELRVQTQTPVKLFDRRQKCLAIAAVSGDVREGEQALPHSL
jgi:hypothetical protein